MAGGHDVRGYRSEQCREEGILIGRESLEAPRFHSICACCCCCRLGKQRYLLYVAAQLLGAICGSALLRLSLPPSYLDTPFVTAGSATAAHPIQVFLLEFTCTFVLVYVVFATVVDKAGAAKVLNPPHTRTPTSSPVLLHALHARHAAKKPPTDIPPGGIFVCRKCLCATRLAAHTEQKKQNAAPLTIGLAMTAGVFAEGPFTGSSMNPARTIGAAVAFLNFRHILIYLIATITGAICAGLCYDKIYLEDVQPAELEDRDETDA